MLQDLTFYSLLVRCKIPCPCQAKPHLNLVRACGVFNMLTLKCVKSGLNPSVFFPLLTSKRASRHKGVGYVVGSDHGKCGYSGNLQVIDLMHIYDAHIHIYIYTYNIILYIYIYIEIITTYKPQKMKQQLFTV